VRVRCAAQQADIIITARHGRFHKGNASRLGKLGAAANARKRMENPHETFLHPTQRSAMPGQ
jgi:DICT domain-containing protein